MLARAAPAILYSEGVPETVSKKVKFKASVSPGPCSDETMEMRCLRCDRYDKRF